MKLINFGVAALCAVALIGCGKKNSIDDFKTVKLDKTATLADSVCYYLGEQIVSSRFNLQQQDSTFKSKENLQKYDEGFYAGLQAMSDNEAYNQGYATGVQVASQLAMMKKQLGENFNVDAIAAGYASAFDKSGNKVAKFDENLGAHQIQLQTLMQRVQMKAQEKQQKEALKKVETAKKKLSAEAKKGGYKQVNGIYVKTLAAGNGTQLKKGDRITATLGIKNAKGEELFPAMPQQQTVGDNSSYSPAIEAIITTLEMNGQYQIIGTLDQLFAEDMAAQMAMSGQMDPEQLYIFDYTVGPAEDTPAN